ncbi:MAG: carboxypeptidase regulatory-like domain-containing protein [Terracidiphilus sp.]
MMIRHSWAVVVCALSLALFSGFAYAQNSNSGDIRGTVTDSSGALVPGVNVTVTSNDTGVVTKYVTDSDGLYDTNSILPGSYTLVFTKQGFETFKRGPVTLQIGSFTVDAQLKVGAANTVIQVSSEAPLLKTESAEVSTTISTTQLANLPNVDPSGGYEYLLKLLPGSTSTAPTGGGGGGGGGDTEPAFDQAIGGTMPYFSSYLVDGGSIWLPHSANTDQGISEAVSELNVIATDAPAQYGGGGSVFNVLTKTGTEQFHGSLYDYFQNDDLNARSYFNRGAKAKQRYNYYGGAVGGPIVKNKMFFYYNYQALKNPNSSYSVASEPTAAMKAGCFNPTLFGTSLTLDAAHGGTALTTNPTQCAAFEPATDLAIPTADFDPVANNIQTDYWLTSQQGNGVLSNNYSYLAPGNGDLTKMLGRLDYDITPKNRIDFSIIERWNPLVESLNDGSNAPNCPVSCHNGSVDGGNGELSDVWTITQRVVNEFRFSFNREANYFAQASLNQGIRTKIGLSSTIDYADVLPTINIGGTGAPSSITPGTEALFIQNTFDPSDMVTWVLGKNILHFGGEVLMEEDNSTPWGGINGATMSFSGQFTTSDPTVEVGYADFLLGDVQGWNTSTQPKHYMRAKNPSFFVQDDIKLRPSLTINLGLRSETHGGSIEKKNNAGGFDPTLTDPASATLYPFINALGSIWFAGENGARTQSYATKTLVMPRLGFAWQASNNWVVRGGVGQYSALWSEDTVGGVMGFGSGCGVPGLCGAVGSTTTTSITTPVVQLSGSGSALPVVTGAVARTPLNYITPATPQGSGGTIPYTPYNLPIQNGWQWTAGVQRRLPGNMVAEAQYVGSHWGNMMFESDINQLPASKLGDGQDARPYPQFSGIGVGSGGSRTGSYNGISNYQSAQFMLHVAPNHGVSGDVSYSWSRLYDDMDDSGWGNQFGNVSYQDAFTPSANYGPSNFNSPNTLKGTIIYAVPLGKGHRYLSSALGDAVLGGWQMSGVVIAEQGTPFTPVMNSGIPDGDLGASDGNSAAALYPNVVGNPNSGGHSIKSWFNQLAYAVPAVDTFGNEKRNTISGPGFQDEDFSLAKSWSLPGWESGKVQLRMDAFNIFDHPSFSDPNNALIPTALSTMTPSPSVGNITGTVIGGRTIQLSGRFSF